MVNRTVFFPHNKLINMLFLKFHQYSVNYDLYYKENTMLPRLVVQLVSCPAMSRLQVQLPVRAHTRINQ